MDIIMRPVWAEINLDIIANNMKNIKALVGDKEIMAIVKADCYGHGSLEVVPELLANGASRLAVAMISEAIKLRENNISVPIMILGYTPIHLCQQLINYNIEQTVYDLDYAKELSNLALSLNKKAKIHIALDTGMGRIGFLPNEESLKIVSEINNLKGIEIVGIFTHFSSADEKDKTYTIEQFEKIQNFIQSLKDIGIDIPFKHASNSGAIIDMPNTYLDCVRAGIILYGYYPSNDVDKSKLDVKPALTLKANVAHVKELEPDMYIGYNRTFKTKRKSVIATIPIGYADGYSRKLSNNGKVIVNGKLAPIVGNVCMDQIMVDVTDVGPVKTGDEVVLLGEVGETKYNADDMAKDIQTINYEVICALKNRVPKVFIKNNKIIKVNNNL